MKPIKALQSLDDAIVILRNAILRLTGLGSQFVVNALSAYGTDLAKMLFDMQESIRQPDSNPAMSENDSLLLFEAISDNDSNDNMMQQSDAYNAYRLHVIIYGEGSEEIAVKLKARLLLIDEKVNLNTQGVQIRSISNIESMNEFKNEVMWQRRDMDIHFAFRREYTFE